MAAQGLALATNPLRRKFVVAPVALGPRIIAVVGTVLAVAWAAFAVGMARPSIATRGWHKLVPFVIGIPRSWMVAGKELIERRQAVVPSSCQ